MNDAMNFISTFFSNILSILPFVVSLYSIYSNRIQSLKLKELDSENQQKMLQNQNEFQRIQDETSFYQKLDYEKRTLFFQNANDFNYNIGKLIVHFNSDTPLSVDDKTEILKSIYNCKSLAPNTSNFQHHLRTIEFKILRKFTYDSYDIHTDVDFMNAVLECHQELNEYFTQNES